ncbi:hypothetical protein AS361_15215 [Myroides marinus]|nr:hypothetical protein AS361_15215 [Myroides marinus]
MQCWVSGKTEGFQLDHIPKRSTLSDANKNREVSFFEDVYNQLLYKYTISDSRIKDIIKE